mgnify:CR=1 FL=1
MKRWVVFLLGMIAGGVLTFVMMLVLAIGANTSSNGMTLFDEPGDCLSTKTFEVMQVVDNNHALAHEIEWNAVLQSYMSNGLLVLLTNDNGEYYYDDQVIEPSKALKGIIKPLPSSVIINFLPSLLSTSIFLK